ncbi:hypothetical protein [Microbacterium telephonicum]|uniref:hypothetical protein n=1 Tax=Microbacterium telephonicum TaxID=1714841 RepID=UPI0011C4A46C|nr:hypothetical protein [Microbacterium telephonicum]
MLSSVLQPPQTPQALRPEHVETVLRIRSSQIGEGPARIELRNVGLCFEFEPLLTLIDSEAHAVFRRRIRYRHSPRGGYSDGELARLVGAARQDVSAMVRRLETEDDESIADGVAAGRAQNREDTESRYLNQRDLTPMLVLLVANSGWNVESIKELPHEHRVMEGLAVEIDLLKRRRGPSRWHNNVTWEIGPPSKALFTPGGTYLVLHNLMEAARRRMSEPSFWALWHSGKGDSAWRNPFARNLSSGPAWSDWIERRQIMADPAPDGAVTLLRLDFNRLKTSVDVRRTRQMGGHLPSSTLSNSTAVLFRNYLSGDASMIDWSQEVVSESVEDLLSTALTTHRDALAAQGRTSLDVRPLQASQVDRENTTGTAWSSCADHDHHPVTGRRCTASFLLCFQCANSIVTAENLPRLISLLDALEVRRREVSEESWWRRYGPAWAAIRLEILPKFTEAELAHAADSKPDDSYLDLVEPPWERE